MDSLLHHSHLVCPKNRSEDNIKIAKIKDKVAGSCGQHYEGLGPIKDMGFINELSNCQLVRQAGCWSVCVSSDEYGACTVCVSSDEYGACSV